MAWPCQRLLRAPAPYVPSPCWPQGPLHMLFLQTGCSTPPSRISQVLKLSCVCAWGPPPSVSPPNPAVVPSIQSCLPAPDPEEPGARMWRRGVGTALVPPGTSTPPVVAQALTLDRGPEHVGHEGRAGPVWEEPRRVSWEPPAPCSRRSLSTGVDQTPPCPLEALRPSGARCVMLPDTRLAAGHPQ